MIDGLEKRLELAASLIAGAGCLIITAGAGMGVDSGLPDFRGEKGFWRAYPGLKRRGLSFVDVANAEYFSRAPGTAWGFYGHRLNLYRKTVPHEGFQVLRRWAEAVPDGAAVFTSNVDGHFQKVGFRTVHECHGSIHYLQCSELCCRDVWPVGGFLPLVDDARCMLLNEPPRCSRCGAVTRPNILMFNDGYWSHEREEIQRVKMDNFLYYGHRPVVIELGAGKSIPTVRYFSERVAMQHEGHLIRINPQDFKVPRQHFVGLPMGALEGLRAINRLLVPSG